MSRRFYAVIGIEATIVVGLVIWYAGPVVLRGCSNGKDSEPTTASEARATIEAAFQAHLPQSAANERAESKTLMTLVIYGMFDCAAVDLAAFLQESRLLPDELTPGNNVLGGMGGGPVWWQPRGESNVSGTECGWEDGDDAVSCQLTSSSNDGRATVRFMVVYENKKQTGLRSDVKADPNWRR